MSVQANLVKSCRTHGLGHSDAAKRLCDGVRSGLGRISFDEILAGRWLAFRLSDGSCDRTLYDSKRDAVRFQSDEFLCGYIKLNFVPMTECEAEIMLTMHRNLYDAGFRMPDPDRKDGGKQPIMPIAREDRLKAIAEFDRYSRR